MPRIISTSAEDSIELAELVDMLETQPFEPRDEECFASWGEALKRLANNRSFLSDMVIAELKDRCAGQVRGNQYSPQVIMLHGASKKFFLRANFWPALRDSVVRQSGTSPFFYNLAHDHNFSFLTVGYLGPGYWSDYYEYDYERVHGHVGEHVDLRFVERAKLDPGKVMLYRAHRDIHLQLPADELSVSLNILEGSHGVSFRDQYRFDIETSSIAGHIAVLSLEQLVAMAAHFGGANGCDLLDNFVASHPSDRMRFHALKAQAAALGTLDERIACYERATRVDSRLVSEMARREAGMLERSRDWIEGRVLRPAA